MLFMVIGGNNQAFYMLPPEKMMEQAMLMDAWTRKQLESGKCKAIYVADGNKRYFSIWELASYEEGVQLSMAGPTWQYQDFEVIPVVDYDQSMKLAMSAPGK